MAWKRQPIGHGVGLRPPHFARLLEGPPEVDWFEVISENVMIPGGRPIAVLERVRSQVPVVLHGVSMGIGSVDPLNVDYLRDLRDLADRVQPAWVSDHLCWGGFGSHYAHDLLPLPYTEEALDHVISRVVEVQDRLRRQILLENVSSYVAFAHSTMAEWEFLSAVANGADCGLLVDVNNIYVSGANHGFSPRDYLDGIPAARVGQFHVAGHTDMGTHLFDSHEGPIIDEVWELYRYAVGRFGEVPTLIEWDENIPDYDELVAESRRARSIQEEAIGETQPSRRPVDVLDADHRA